MAVGTDVAGAGGKAVTPFPDGLGIAVNPYTVARFPFSPGESAVVAGKMNPGAGFAYSGLQGYKFVRNCRLGIFCTSEDGKSQDACSKYNVSGFHHHAPLMLS